jgi:uncharacterized membrane protein YiaA
MNNFNPIHTTAPSTAFVFASWTALLVGFVSFLVGLYNSGLGLANQGFFFVLLMYGLFSAISVQKSVRDQLEGIPVTGLYLGLSWFSTLLCILLMAVGLINTPSLGLSTQGFYAMSFVLTIFAAIAVQKNVRDEKASK